MGGGGGVSVSVSVSLGCFFLFLFLFCFFFSLTTQLIGEVYFYSWKYLEYPSRCYMCYSVQHMLGFSSTRQYL